MEHVDGLVTRRRRVRPTPYILLVPAIGALALMLGFPLVRLVTLSLQDYGLKQQFGAPAEWVGLRNFRDIWNDSEFWAVLKRTVVFCAVNVALTMAIGMSTAMLLKRLGTKMRLLVIVGLMFAWSMPALTSTVIWQWIFDTQYGLANWLLGRQGESWLSDPLSFYFVATIIVVWMGVPFIAITLYAGLTTIPDEMLEAAAIDGATPWQRFRDIVAPSLKPILLILTSLSVLWDFRVFTQVYVLQSAGGINRETNLLGVYAYRTSIGSSEFDRGAAIAIVMVLITVLLTLVYLRSMVRQEELVSSADRARKRRSNAAFNAVGIAVFAVFAFPVYWMILTSFRRGVDIQQPTPEFIPSPGTLQNYRKVFERDFFWTAVKNSLTVTLSVLGLALVIAFLAAVAVSRFKFSGRKAFIIMILLVQMVPMEALIISLFKILDGWKLVNTTIGLSLTYLAFVLPFTIWTLRGFVAGVPRELEDAAMVDGSTRFRAFMTITLPLVAPGLIATGVFAFIQAWNEFIFALVIMNKPEQQTLPVWLQAFNEGAKGTDWGGVMAGSTLMAIPVVVFFLLVQKRLASGLTAGAVKG